ncbi:UDP-GlcNAc:betaGal beta-1,3-N-acetylglucosaminyltransferase 9 [Hypomesus transpacificus]|uniref:UDP-GlcNAc:betaGal beta-1,3-N-acetylglucosaminyltransferase 9 n=1 Tax=Hypomesus transpacificus TaxID=137520 RepID=UPI001F074B05|nr:UDP-GlcNAc:betaGal beta-1,3-N-acetylglucosaminyltransferase 9 [Hypomesus transpacificus]XP_046890220.1 UDP-GlcNAc:betaGal beta-1,3-N-acetylglucosaminyltransferase 9 [Hypomesus transpacificus]
MMRRVHVKGDVLCTLLLLVVLCALLYAHQGLSPSWEWSLQLSSPSSRALLGAPSDPQGGARPPSKPSDAPPRCQPDAQTRNKPQAASKPKQAKPKVQSKAKSPGKWKGKKGAPTKPSAAALPTRPPFDFQAYLREKDHRSFQLLIDQPEKCSVQGGSTPDLLIAVKSVAVDFDKRQVVRRTWGQEGLLGDGVTVRTVFLLGVPRNQSALPLWDRLLAYESQTFRDILLWDFQDTFFNLTLKETHFLQWVNTSCPGVRFIFKGDADVYVNVENILEMLKGQRSDTDLFVGDIIFNARPIRRRSSKYFVPEFMYGGSMYPSYAGGGGFVMSGFTACRLSSACQQVELFPIDDVFLGMCLQRIGLKPTRHEGFRTFGIVRPSAAPHLQVFDPCFYRELMVVHSLTVPQIWLMWSLLHDPKLTCHSRLAPTPWPFQWRRKGSPMAGGSRKPEDHEEQDYGVRWDNYKVFVKH